MKHVLPAGASQCTIDSTSREVVRSAAYYYVDFARYADLDTTASFDQVDSITGIEHLFNSYDRGRGVILASAHLGNPEWIAQSLAPIFDTLVLTEQLEPPEFHIFVHEIRNHSGARFVPANRHGIREALHQLRSGNVLGILIDRDVLGTGEPFPFFGEPASLPTGIVELAWATEAAIVLGFVLRTQPGRYRITLQEVVVPTRSNSSGNRNVDIEHGMHLVIQVLEDGIRSAPDQWFPLSPIWSSSRSGK